MDANQDMIEQLRDDGRVSKARVSPVPQFPRIDVRVSPAEFGKIRAAIGEPVTDSHLAIMCECDSIVLLRREADFYQRRQ